MSELAVLLVAIASVFTALSIRHLQRRIEVVERNILALIKEMRAYHVILRGLADDIDARCTCATTKTICLIHGEPYPDEPGAKHEPTAKSVDSGDSVS